MQEAWVGTLTQESITKERLNEILDIVENEERLIPAEGTLTFSRYIGSKPQFAYWVKIPRTMEFEKSELSPNDQLRCSRLLSNSSVVSSTQSAKVVEDPEDRYSRSGWDTHNGGYF